MSSQPTPRGLSRNKLMLLLAAALFASLYFFWYQKSCFRYQLMSGTATCSKVDTFYMGPLNEYGLPYYCNEVILDPSHSNADSLRIYLKNNCFKLQRTCPCEPAYELWMHMSVEGIDLGTVVQKPPITGGIGDGSGLMVNAVIDLQHPPSKGDVNKYSDSLKTNTNCPPRKMVRLAIVDSGVDTSKDMPHSVLRQFGWHPFNHPSSCIPNAMHEGLNMVTLPAHREPEDLHGHGTSVNSVASGASTPNYKQNIPLEILNVRFTKDHTKSGGLFDALCGLNYAMAQDPHIINISWGFLFLLDTKTELMDKTLVKIFNTFLDTAESKNILVIAGIGNNSTKLTSTVKFYPASQVHTHDNGLSIGALSYDPGAPDLARFSNFCSQTENYMTLAVPGELIKCAQPMYVQAGLSPSITPTGFQRKSGTSFAAPMVSRIAALIISIHDYPAPNLVKTKLLSFTTTLTKSGNPGLPFKAVHPDSIKAKICLPMVNPVHPEL